MARGKILHITREDALWRALSQIVCVPTPPKGAPAGAGNRPIAYRLEEANGGFDPRGPLDIDGDGHIEFVELEANHCASWSFGNRTPTADCIGFVMWASGVDRCQPGFKTPRVEGWLNCRSLMDDSRTSQRFCRLLRMHEAPLPGDWLLTDDHIGMVIRSATAVSDLLVVDCSPRHGRPTAINTGLAWSEACVVVRPLVYKEAVANVAALKAA